MYARMLDAVGVAVENLAVLAAHIFFRRPLRPRRRSRTCSTVMGKRPVCWDSVGSMKLCGWRTCSVPRIAVANTLAVFAVLQSRHRNKPHARMRSAAVATNCLLIVEPPWTWPIAFW